MKALEVKVGTAVTLLGFCVGLTAVSIWSPDQIDKYITGISILSGLIVGKRMGENGKSTS